MLAKRRIENVEVREAIQQRYHHRFSAHCRRDGGDARCKVVRFARKQNDVVVGLHGFSRHGRWAQHNTLGRWERVLYDEPISANLRRTFIANKEGNVSPGFKQASAKIATDAACAQHKSFHDRTFDLKNECVIDRMREGEGEREIERIMAPLARWWIVRQAALPLLS
jgi:hypothetical protein